MVLAPEAIALNILLRPLITHLHLLRFIPVYFDLLASPRY